MKRHFALLVAFLVGVLVLAGQLARAAPHGNTALPGNAAPKCTAIGTAASIFLTASAAAQSSSSTTIHGTVKDETGAAIT